MDPLLRKPTVKTVNTSDIFEPLEKAHRCTSAAQGLADLQETIMVMFETVEMDPHWERKLRHARAYLIMANQILTEEAAGLLEDVQRPMDPLDNVDIPRAAQG